MRRALSLLLALTVLPLAAHAQAVATSRALWQQVTAQVTQIAEELPESTYGFKPTPEVRSFGQLFGHIAGAQYLMCAAAVGDAPREEDAVEKSTTTKAGLVAALKASTAYCEKAYAQSDADATGATRLFGEDRTRLYALGMNAIHNGEHYGNLVTYLRMNGIVPPASRPRR
jgi:uncharacterized damage-inducible protein DinB